MCDKLIELLFKSDEYSTGEGRMGGLCISGFEEDFRHSFTYKITMEAGKQRRIEGGNVNLNGKLFKGKRNENSDKGQKIGMEKYRQRGASGIGTGTSGLSNIYK